MHQIVTSWLSHARAPLMCVLAVALGLALTAADALNRPTSAMASTLSPVVSRGADGATADALPTVQIDGIVWTQVIVGNTVYAGGEFQTARPAGAAPGTQTVARSNLLAFDLTTGELINGFAPKVDGAVRALAISPDKKTLYVGGAFTAVNNKVRNRLAAMNPATGALYGMAPAMNGTVRTILPMASTVYVGGAFTQVGTTARSRLAAFTPTGQLRSWRPPADATVQAMTLTPDRRSLVVGGSFSKIGMVPACGMTRLTLAAGSVQSWTVNKSVKDCGVKASIMSLTSDSSRVYGSGYSWGGGNFEGVFAANGTGQLSWVQDCRGDTYSVAVGDNRIYSVGHAHNCGNIGGFPEQNPLTNYRAIAVTLNATGKVGTSAGGYKSYTGLPSPSLVNWFPSLTPGAVTGTSQAAWSIVASGPYVVLGGEFTAVNGVPQQGLVRMATESDAPKKMGPVGVPTGSQPTLVQNADCSVGVSYQTAWDRDDQELTYTLLRDNAPVDQRTLTSHFWAKTTQTVQQSDLVAGQQYTWRVRVTDPDGNQVTSNSATITAVDCASTSSARKATEPEVDVSTKGTGQSKQEKAEEKAALEADAEPAQ